MAKRKDNNKELQEALADQKWWQDKVGKPLGLRLSGWSNRHTASFYNEENLSIQIPGWFAERIIKIKS